MADLSFPPSSGSPLAASWSREAAEGLIARWCDALLARQIAGTGDPMLDGAIACPACGVLHGRVAQKIVDETGLPRRMVAEEKNIRQTVRRHRRASVGVAEAIGRRTMARIEAPDALVTREA